MQGRSLSNIILFAVLSLTGGLAWFISKFQVENIVNIEMACAWRYILSGIIMLFLSIVFRCKMLPRRRDIKTILICGLFGCCLNLILFYYAIPFTITCFSCVIFSFAVIINAIIARMLGQIQNIFQTLIYGIIGIFGLSLMVFQGAESFAKPHLWIGIALAIVATISFCISSTYYQNHDIQIHPMAALGWFSLAGGTMCFIFSIAHYRMSGMEITIMPNLSKEFISSLAVVVLISTCLWYTCYFALSKRIGSPDAAYSTLAGPIVAMAMSAVYEGYYFTPMAMIGMAMVIISEFIVLRRIAKGRKAKN